MDMDLQKVLDNAVQVQRAEVMKTSVQLVLGELILKMEGVKNKALPCYFDVDDYYPIAVNSWRGSYCELAIEYGKGENKGERVQTVSEILGLLKETVGAIFIGYKGGDYMMGKTTPVWVANYGNSGGFRELETAIIDVQEKDDKVVIITKSMEY